MCTHWTAEEWQEKSQPVKRYSRYTLVDTRYHQDGSVARTYRETDGTWYAVYPGYGNSPMFFFDNAQTRALEQMAARGYNLLEPLALEEKPMTIAELIGDAPAAPDPQLSETPVAADANAVPVTL